MNAQTYLTALGVLVGVGFVAWLVSIPKRDVSFVDSLWSLFFLIAAGVYAAAAGALTVRAGVVLILVAIWALRLSIYITVRNWDEPEDSRYQAIRAKNEPGFIYKSLYIVFGFQALLAWIVSLPLLPAIASTDPLGAVDYAAILLWLLGFTFEALGDWQLARFKADPSNRGKVMDRGLWRYTRHPNYFGDFCVWWSFYLFAVAAGAWWSVVSPLIMSFLLLRVSGVALLEKSITDRRPGYADYIRRTNAFFPGAPRRLRSTNEV